VCVCAYECVHCSTDKLTQVELPVNNVLDVFV
jgi:hypothetical protein